MAKMSNEVAVSPIVATLVLIVVAVIGAVAVGTVMGIFSTSVQKQANAQQAASASQTEILVDGSWLGVVAEQNIATDFEKINPGINVNVQGGGGAVGVESVAMGMADIGAVHSQNSSQNTIISSQNSNPTDSNYQNLYFMQVGGRGIVFIQDQSGVAVPNNVVSASDINTLYSNVAADGTEKGIANNFSVTTNVTVFQYPPGRFPNQAVFFWAGLPQYWNGGNSNAPNAVVEYLGPDMLLAVQAGSASHPAFGYIDDGLVFGGDSTSNTTVPGIKIVDVATGPVPTYPPKQTLRTLSTIGNMDMHRTQHQDQTILRPY